MRDAHAGLARALVRTFHSQISSFLRREKVRRPARSKVSCRWRCRSMLGLLLCKNKIIEIDQMVSKESNRFSKSMKEISKIRHSLKLKDMAFFGKKKKGGLVIIN